ncbi:MULTISPECIES: hypothetical protein [Olivibacter]|uniref:Uncharacterized protein n=1 Tax=Olivibacter jilunii TaxID=985016 RepID=A0ABW6AYQ5_9SPHI
MYLLSNKIVKTLFIVLMNLVISAFFCNAAGSPEFALPGAALLTGLSFVPNGMPLGSLAISINAKDILFPQGRFNPGGIKPGVYYAFEEDIQKWPDAMLNVNTETATTFSELINIPATDPFVFVAGKSFKKLYCTLETGEVKYSKIGVRDGAAWQQGVEISYPSNDAEIEGFLASAGNRQMVILVPEQSGRVKVVGMPGYPAVLDTTEGTSGKAVEEGNAAVINLMSKASVPPMIYLPPIELGEEAPAGGA